MLVIRTQYRLTNIKACEKCAFHFWMALIFCNNRPIRWCFSRPIIHLVVWLFYVCPVYRSATLHPHFSLLLDDLTPLFTEKMKDKGGHVYELPLPECCLFLHLCPHRLPFSTPRDVPSCSHVNSSPPLVFWRAFPSCLFKDSISEIAPFFSLIV